MKEEWAGRGWAGADQGRGCVGARTEKKKRRRKSKLMLLVKVEDRGKKDKKKKKRVFILVLDRTITNEDVRIKDRADDEEAVVDTTDTAGRNERTVEEGELFDAGGLGVVREVDRKDFRRSEGVRDGMRDKVEETGMAPNVEDVWIDGIDLDVVDTSSRVDRLEEIETNALRVRFMRDRVNVDEVREGFSDVEVLEIRRDVDAIGHPLVIEDDVATESIKVDD